MRKQRYRVGSGFRRRFALDRVQSGFYNELSKFRTLLNDAVLGELGWLNDGLEVLLEVRPEVSSKQILRIREALYLLRPALENLPKLAKKTSSLIDQLVED